jgi:hypothetical protein
MRIVVLALISLAVGSLAARSEDAWKEGWAENIFKDQKTGQLDLSKDFGTVPRGTQLYKRFKITNIYKVPLEINATAGCTCLTVTPAKQQLQSLQEGFIDVVMDAAKFKGQRNAKVNVTVGPTFISSTTLLISCGVVTSGSAIGPQTLDIEYAGPLDWRLTELVTHDAPLDVSFQELYRRHGQVGYRVSAAIKADAAPGSFKHELFFRTNDSASPLLPILVEGTIQGGLSAVPETVDMGKLKIGESITKLVLVRATKEFRILGVDGAGNGVSAEIRQAPSKVQLVKVKYQPTQAGDLHRQLKIKTDLTQENSVVVTLQGAGEPQ